MWIINKKHSILAHYTLQNKTIKEVTHAKYIGVTICIDQNLSWSEPIKKVTNKTNRVKGFLQRNLNRCPLQIKNGCYKSHKTYLGICSYHSGTPHTHRDINAFKNVQRCAARFVTNVYSRYASVTEILSSLKWFTSSRCRNEQKAIMLFKIINYQVDNDINFLIPISNDHNTRDHSMRFLQSLTRVDSYNLSFFPSTIKIWYLSTWLIQQRLNNLSTD